MARAARFPGPEGGYGEVSINQIHSCLLRRHGHIFRGPSPMNAVADKTQPNIYFSWPADLEYGKAASAGDEGRVYVPQLQSPWPDAVHVHVKVDSSFP